MTKIQITVICTSQMFDYLPVSLLNLCQFINNILTFEVEETSTSRSQHHQPGSNERQHGAPGLEPLSCLVTWWLLQARNSIPGRIKCPCFPSPVQSCNNLIISAFVQLIDMGCHDLWIFSHCLSWCNAPVFTGRTAISAYKYDNHCLPQLKQVV